MNRTFQLHDEQLMLGKLKQQAILSEVLRQQEFGEDLPEAEMRRRFFLMYQIRSILFRLAPRLAARLVL